MPPKSQAQDHWARAGCPGSNMPPEKCAEFVAHGKGSVKRLPVRKGPTRERRMKRAKIAAMRAGY